MLDLLTEADAVISDCERYRYRLTRRWDDGPTCTFIMLNPSTADARKDDPTIRRCIGFARREGCAALLVINCFAFRATKPADLFAAEDPIGPENDRHIMAASLDADGQVIAAWGDRRSGLNIGSTTHSRRTAKPCRRSFFDPDCVETPIFPVFE